MAIYHLHVKSISRGTGSAQAKADYISREGKYQADRDEIAYAEHGHMPKWAEDSPRLNNYWQNADIYERTNGRLFVHVEFALPAELTRDQQRDLARDFCQKLAQTSKGQKLPYSMAIHKGRSEKNPHCHLMINERINDGIARQPSDWFRRANPKSTATGGAQKTEELRSKFWLRDTRKMWADMANESLKKNGHNDMIDHRTLAAQGIDRKPQYHLGPAAAAMERKNNAKGKNKEAVTDRGAEYNDQQEIASLEKELEALKKAKDRQDSGQLEKEKLQRGQADVRAKFEQWKADKQAREISRQQEQKRQQENQKPERNSKPKMRGDFGR